MGQAVISAFDRFEHIGDIQLPTTNTDFFLPTFGGQLPNDKFIHTLRLQFEGRVTNAAANNPTGTQADAPFSLIELIRINGTHRIRQAFEEFYIIRGADARELCRHYNNHVPLSTPASLALGALATNDIRFVIDLPMVPEALPIRQQLDWLLDAPNYDALKLVIRFSDDKSIFTGQTSASTFSAFGSATGSPRIRVSGLFAIAGTQGFAGYLPGRPWRYFVENTSTDLSASQTQARLYNVPRGWWIRNILVKTGVKSTVVTAGNNVYNSLSNGILSNINVFRGLNKKIRFYPDSFALSEDTGFKYGLSPSTGFGLIDFAARGSQSEFLNTRGLIAGPTGDVDVFVAADTVGAANQAALFLVQECRNPARVRR